MKVRVSMFADAFSKEPRDCELSSILDAIRSGRYAEQVLRLRDLRVTNPDAYNREKRMLPAFCVSGTAASRTEPLEHSGLLQVDLDKLNGRLDELRSKAKADPHIAFGFVSPSGEGLKLGLRIDGERHAESFEAARNYFLANYGVKIDEAVKDRLRICFVSDDPELWSKEATPLPAPEHASTHKTNRSRANRAARSKAGAKSEAADNLCCPEDDLPAITAWLRGQVASILDARGMTEEARNENVSRIVVNALINIGAFYCDAARPEFGGTLFFNHFTSRLESVRSDSFRSWLSDLTALNRANKRFQFVQAAVENAALTGPTTRMVRMESYWASRPGAIYLSSGDGKLVKITADGVTFAQNGTDDVLFPVGKTLAPWKLTDPTDPFVTCDLFRDAQIESHHGRHLLQLWVYSLPTNPRSKPPLVASGAVRSGKTRTVEGVAELFGIHFFAQSVDERGADDFWVSVNEGGLLCLDNADTRYRWLADAVASASTGGCSQRRKLYSNSETITLHARSWIAITTANPTFASDAGLADRLLLARMNRRIGRTSDAALSHQIAKHRDAGLSHIAQTLRAALADTQPVPTGLNKRHPDFAAFAVRIGRALGRESEAIAALQAAEADKATFCLENDSVGAALIAMVSKNGGFIGTAAELAGQLSQIDIELVGTLSAKGLGRRLGAIWPHLEERLDTCQRRPDRDGVMRYHFKGVRGFAGFQMPIPKNSSG